MYGGVDDEKNSDKYQGRYSISSRRLQVCKIVTPLLLFWNTLRSL
jgi:hypothetical protein